jgi:hypothetical protein
MIISLIGYIITNDRWRRAETFPSGECSSVTQLVIDLLVLLGGALQTEKQLNVVALLSLLDVDQFD